MCTVTIDGEQVENIAIRAKGNTSLSSVRTYGNDRYSFKLEFDHYQDGGSYQGLDKLSLNNLIQDNTYMKDYLTYQMMEDFGVDSPLCSYVWITVNGEDWGLYLAVEGVEESFLERNYGTTQGELYKPDSMSMGGGRGFGGDFEMPENFDFSGQDMENMEPPERMEGMEIPENFDPSAMGMPEGFDPNAVGRPGQRPQQTEGDREMPEGMGNMFGGMGSNDVKLVYTDDSFAFVVCSGTAGMNASTTYLTEKDLIRDYFHTTDFGRLITSYVWYAMLAGIDQLQEIKLDAIPKAFLKSTQDKSQDRPLTEMEKAILLESVNNALKDPLKITQSQYTQAPTE